MIIGIGGRFCSGKTTGCDYYVNEHGFLMINFADKLKSICSDLYAMKEKDRRLLQEVGTQLRKVTNSRGEIQDAVWINYLFKNTVKKNEDKNLVIGDMRFENEVIACKTYGAITIFLDVPESIRLERYEKLYGHLPSEIELNHESEKLEPNNFDHVLEYKNISSIPKMYEELNKIIKTK